MQVTVNKVAAFGFYFGTWSTPELPLASGLNHYFLNWVPKFVDTSAAVYSYQPYQLHANAHTGWLEWLEFHPTDHPPVNTP